MELLWHYDQVNTPRKTPREIFSFAEGIWQLRQALMAWDEGAGRTNVEESARVYNEIEDEIERAVKFLPQLILKGRDALVDMHCDELVSRAATIFTEQWLINHTQKYHYPDMQDLNWDLVDACIETLSRLDTA
jgi:predicted deacylase